MDKVATSSTEFTDSDGRDYVITMHALHGYELLCRAVPAEDQTSWTVRSPYDRPNIMQTVGITTDTPTYGVNWPACGTKPADDARAYAALLATAADVADEFTRIAAKEEAAPASHLRLV